MGDLDVAALLRVVDGNTVKIPKLRTGSSFPSLLAPRRRIDVALHAVIAQAWIEGVSTRKFSALGFW